MKVLLVFAIFATFVVSSFAVQNIKQCSNGVKKPADEDVILQNCDKPPCILKKKSEVAIEYKFVPTQDIKKATNKVFGIIGGIPLPFVGVDGTNACGNFYTENGEKTGCPLKAGTTYYFKNKIDILAIYPTVNVQVEWGLTDAGRGKDVFCFLVPARIKN